MRFAKLGALAGAIVVVAAACSSGGTASPSAAAPASAAASTAPASGAPSGSPAASKGTLKIGIELPMSGSESANGVPTANGVKLLVKEVNAAGGVGGYTLDVNQQDDAVNGVHDPHAGRHEHEDARRRRRGDRRGRAVQLERGQGRDPDQQRRPACSSAARRTPTTA